MALPPDFGFGPDDDTGLGGERTDVLAHLTGFLAGFAMGWLIAPFDARRLGRSGQVIAGVLALGLLVQAWSLALAGMS